MKVTLNWLKQYVDFNWSPEELTERLTMLGLEVEGVQKLGGEFTGIVVARLSHVGGTVAAGQPIYSLVDPSRVWIKANIEETKLARLQPGQPVDVYVDALGYHFEGRVMAITPASAATFSLLPSQNASGNFVKVTQLVPVKIEVNAAGATLPLGTSATVRIKVREPGGGVPWQP